MTRSATVVYAAILAMSYVSLYNPAHAIDLTGGWATDTSVCKLLFVKKRGAISFVKNADEIGGGLIFVGNQMISKTGRCSIKSRQEKNNVIRVTALCSTSVATDTVQFSLEIANDDSITQVFPGTSVGVNYVRCPK